MTAEILPMHENERLRAALAYASIGWYIFPAWWIENGKCACGNSDCKSPGKHPISRAVPWGQTNATTDANQIRSWWDAWPKANIAVFLERSELCAIDIDPRNGGIETIDQIETQHGPLTSDLLQFTGGGGEHRVFQLPGNGMTLPGKLGPGVDVKLNGYIMLEPSNHLSGHTYAWEASSDPRDGLMASPLPDWLRDLAFRRVVEPPVSGPANDRVLTITDSQRDELVQALGAIPADDRDTWLQVGMGLKSTHDHQWAFSVWDQWSRKSIKYDPVDQMRVWRSIKATGLDGVTYKSIFALSKKHGLVVRPLHPPSLDDIAGLKASEIPGNDKQEDDSSSDHLESDESDGLACIDDVKVWSPGATSSTPSHLLEMPHKLLRSVVGEMSKAAEATDLALSVAAAIHLASASVARRVVSNKHNHAALFICSVSPTGGGKNAGKNYVSKALIRAFGEAPSSEFHSGTALFSMLTAHPATVMHLDEFGDKLKHALKDASGSLVVKGFSMLKEIYSQCGDILSPAAYSMVAMTKKQREEFIAANRPIQKPHANILAVTTPGQLADAITDSSVEGGLVNRFIFTSASGNVIENDDYEPTPATWLVDHMKHLHEVLRLPGCGGNADDVHIDDPHHEPELVVFSFCDKSMALLNGFKEEIKKLGRNDEFMTNMSQRWRENAMRMALALHAFCEPTAHQIDPSVTAWCIDYCRHYGKQFAVRLLELAVPSEKYGQRRKAYLQAFRANPNGTTSHVVGKNMPWRNDPPKFRNELIADMVASGEIVKVRGHRPKRGPAPIVFVAVEV